MLNEKQKELLKKIVNDRYAIGPFSGMVFNSLQKHNPEATYTANVIELLIKEALDVRLTMEELVK